MSADKLLMELVQATDRAHQAAAGLEKLRYMAPYGRQAYTEQQAYVARCNARFGKALEAARNFMRSGEDVWCTAND